MKITFELTPIELEAAIKDGTLTQLLKHATTVEKVAERAAIQQMIAPAPAAVTPAPAVQAAPQPVYAPEFNPTVAAPAAAPAAFDPMALPGIPPAPAAPPINTATPAPLTPAPMNPAPVAPGTVAPTIDQVRATLAPLIKAGKEAQMQQLFAALGATKLTDIPAERYGELIQKAAAL